MTVRRIDGTVAGVAGAKKSKEGSAVSGDSFNQMLQSMGGVSHAQTALGVEAVAGREEQGSPRARKEQLQYADHLLNDLEEVEKSLAHSTGEIPRQQLRETRDEALRTLSESPKGGQERDLLHRTAVLATVQLAKSDRGDFN